MKFFKIFLDFSNYTKVIFAKLKLVSISKLLIVFILALITQMTILQLTKATNLPYEDNDNSYVIIKNHEVDDDDLTITTSRKVNVNEYSTPSCEEVPLVLKDCITATCKAKTPFGDVFRSITEAKEDGTCLYKEREAGYGGIDCEFNKDVLEYMQNIFDMHFKFLATGEVIKDENFVPAFSNVLQKYCSIVKNSSILNVVTIDQNYASESNKQADKPAELITNAEPSSAVPKSIPSTTTNASVNNKEIINEHKAKPEVIIENTMGIEVVEKVEAQELPKKSSSKLTNLKSLMFSQEELKIINDVIEGLLTGKKPSFEVSTTIAQNFVFYLDSIMYYNQSKWSIWLNSKRISSDLKSNTYKIIDISPSSVTVTWRTSDIDRLIPNWKSKVEEISNNVFENQDNGTIIQIIDDANVLITFTLKPNQSFVVSSLTISEGQEG